jgi:hypothetical protein
MVHRYGTERNGAIETEAILNGLPSLCDSFPVTSRTNNGTSLVASCPNRRAAQTVEGDRGGRTVRCSMASCGS